MHMGNSFFVYNKKENCSVSFNAKKLNDLGFRLVYFRKRIKVRLNDSRCNENLFLFPLSRGKVVLRKIIEKIQYQILDEIVHLFLQSPFSNPLIQIKKNTNYALNPLILKPAITVFTKITLMNTIMEQYMGQRPFVPAFYLHVKVYQLVILMYSYEYLISYLLS